MACVLPLRTLDGRLVRPWAYPVVGGLCGLAWSCALRALMSQVAAGESTFSWAGTFGWILLPGLAIGALLGWAEHLRRVGGHPGRWWLAFAPLLFVAVLQPSLLDPAALFESGVRGGAVALPAFFLVGGLALSGRGPWWLRAGCGLVVLSAIPVWALTRRRRRRSRARAHHRPRAVVRARLLGTDRHRLRGLGDPLLAVGASRSGRPYAGRTGRSERQRPGHSEYLTHPVRIAGPDGRPE